MKIEYLETRQGPTTRVTAETAEIHAPLDSSDQEVREAFEAALERVLALRKMGAA